MKGREEAPGDSREDRRLRRHGRRRESILSPLAHRDFRYVASGSLVSLLGDGVFRVSIALQVYEVDRNPASFAAVALVWAVAQVVTLPLGGWAADRFPRRNLIIAADLWRAAAIGALGFLSVTDRLTIPHLLVVAACFGSGNAFFTPASTALLPDLLPPRELARANAFLGGARPAMLYIVGPFLGAAILALGEPGNAFLLDAGTFLLSAALLARVPSTPVDAPATGKASSPVRDAVLGVRVVLGTRWLWIGSLAAALSVLAYSGPFEALVPFRLVEDFGYSTGEAGLALAPIFAASGVGSIVTAWWIGRHDLPRRSMLIYFLGEALGLSMLVVLGLMTAAWQGVLAGVLIGATFALTEIVWTTTLQRWVDRGVLGRVVSLDWMVSGGVAPISFVVAGQLGGRYGAAPVLVGAGLLGAAALSSLSLIPGARVPEALAAAASQEPPSEQADRAGAAA